MSKWREFVRIRFGRKHEEFGLGHVKFVMSVAWLSGEVEPQLVDGVKAVTVSRKEVGGLKAGILQC